MLVLDNAAYNNHCYKQLFIEKRYKNNSMKIAASEENSASSSPALRADINSSVCSSATQGNC